MILGLSIYFILMVFYVFSILGWVYESTFVSIRTGKPVNRGFLVGPMLPLYGTGATLVYVLLRPVSSHPSLLYALGMLIATVIEYLTSYVLEKLFHAKWWDYSKAPYNLNGRIAIIPSMFWGFLTLFLFDVLEPFAIWLIGLIPEATGLKILAVLILISLADLTYTIIETVNFRKQLETLYTFRQELEQQFQELQLNSLKDDLLAKIGLSEKIENIREKLASLKETVIEEPKLRLIEEKLSDYREKSRSLLKNKHFFMGNRRIVDAFPTMRFIPKNKSSISVKEMIGYINTKVKKNNKD